MAITISGENNNDRILASDGVIDSLSGFNVVGVITATSFTGDLTGDVTGNLTGNVTGNINNSTLLLQTGGTERLRITSTGAVGLGRNDPAFALDIKSSGYSTLRLNNSSETGHGSHDVRIVGGGSNYQNIYFEGSTFKFNTYNGSSVGERLRIDSTGRLLLGQTSSYTVSPAGGTILGVFTRTQSNRSDFILSNQSSADNAGAALVLASHGQDYIIESTGSGNSTDGASALTISKSGSERLRIHSNGKISTGVNNDSYELTIGGLSGGPTLWLRDSGTSGSPRLLFGDTSAALVGGITYNNSSNHMEIATNGIERLRIDSIGRLLVGTTVTSANQSGALNVFGTDGNTAFVSIRRGSNNASGPRLALCKSRNTTDGAASGLVSDNDILGTIHFYGNDSQGFEEGAAIAANIDGTPGSNDLPTRLTFSTTPNGSDTKQERLRITSSGNVGINEGNPADKLVVNGTTDFKSNSYIGGDLYMYGSSYTKGIFLGGSGSEYKLDYYKKGNWTPQMWRSSVNSEITIGSGNRYGRYIRIGKLLHISFYWYNPSLSQSSSTAWVLRNLPFDLETGSTSAYQFIPGGYYFFENNSGYGDSSTGAGMLRWQANGTFSSNTLTLYSDNNARNANGAVEFSGTGTLVLP